MGPVTLDLGEMAEWAAAGPFEYGGVPSFAGISGGRTSALMAALVDPRVTLCFENTGREHPKTLEFLRRLADALKREIVWLEWRPADRKGAPPREFGFAVVTYETATRTGVLFDGMQDAAARIRPGVADHPGVPEDLPDRTAVREAHEVPVEHLLRVLPEVYAEWERQEEGLRIEFGKDVAILRDRRGGVTKPLPLSTFRQWQEAGKPCAAEESLACGCFTGDDDADDEVEAA